MSNNGTSKRSWSRNISAKMCLWYQSENRGSQKFAIGLLPESNDAVKTIAKLERWVKFYPISNISCTFPAHNKLYFLDLYPLNKTEVTQITFTLCMMTVVYPFGGNLLSPAAFISDWLVAEELKYSRNRARRHWRPSNNLLGVWQKLAIFSGRPIGAAVEALLTIIVNQRLSSSPMGFVFVAAAVSVA